MFPLDSGLGSCPEGMLSFLPVRMGAGFPASGRPGQGAIHIASAAAFAAGTTIERHTASSESQAAQQDQRHHSEVGGPGDNSAGVEGAANGESSTMQAAKHSSETLLGVNPEATGLVVIAVAVSLALAALILTVRSPLLAAGVALVMLAFTALDTREVTHQLNESHPGLTALAATVALPGRRCRCTPGHPRLPQPAPRHHRLTRVRSSAHQTTPARTRR